ncbi:MAG: GerMN domain-containing protein [Lachnospiraceae bacterium]|nr:GerMN domain-containing protein [Lachnospiraceae bacterium]
MKKQIRIISLIAILVFGIIGCSQKESVKDNKNDSKKAAEVNKTDKEKGTTENKNSGSTTEKPATDTNATDVPSTIEAKKITVYYMNTNVDGFLTETVEVPEITADALVEQLISKSILTPEVKLLSCKESTIDGVKALDLNFSSTLDTFMNNVGSSAEYYVVGSICNTFLEAYNAEKIKITVEDGAFETGHAEYPGYMFKFED